MDYYKEYVIYPSSYGWVIKKNNRFIIEVATDTEAKEYIDNLEEDSNDNSLLDQKAVTTIEDIFKAYCSKLPGVRYCNNCILETYNKVALDRFIDAFKKKYNVEIIDGVCNHGDETFYSVEKINIVKDERN